MTDTTSGAVCLNRIGMLQLMQQAMLSNQTASSAAPNQTNPWYTPTGGITSAAGDVYIWNSSNSTASTVITVGQDWVIMTPQEYYGLAQGRVVHYREITEQEREAELELERLRQERETCARDLLLSHLTLQQRDTFEKNHWFIVQGGTSKKRYRIKTTGINHNIEELNGRDKIAASICCHINNNVNAPYHDHYLAQKISLEYNEVDFLRIANIARR